VHVRFDRFRGDAARGLRRALALFVKIHAPSPDDTLSA
jgi:hypothetical protein